MSKDKKDKGEAPKDEEVLLSSGEAENLAQSFGFQFSVPHISDLMSRRELPTLQKLGGVEGCSVALKTNLKEGLSTEEAETEFADRKTVFGANIFDEPPAANFFLLWISVFKDRTIQILTVAATVSLVLGLIPAETLGDTSGGHSNEWIEGVAIYIAIIIVATVTSVNEFSKDRQFRSLNKAKNNFSVKVVRGGNEMKINNYDILVGDVVVLAQGDQIPADGIYISGFDLYVDESRVTGEPEHVRKSTEKDPFMYSGCQIGDGLGKMLVVATGMNSEWGKTLAKLQEPPEQTPLQKKLDNLAGNIGKVGTAVAVLVFMILTIWWLAVDVVNQPWAWAKLRSIVFFFIIGVTIVVVAVPEGLPLAVTISLAYSMSQMMLDQNLVRHLSACETMGGATTICSDKTGTLTENKMTVVEGWIAGHEFKKVPMEHTPHKTIIKYLFEGIALNSNAALSTDPSKPDTGLPTEVALLKYITALGGDYKKIREKFEILRMNAFSSARKRMSAIVKKDAASIAAGGAPYILHCKGASEIILRRCVRYLDSEGNVLEMSDAMREELTQRIDGMAENALRTLTLAYRDIDKLKKWKEPPEEELTLVGIVGIMDPVRPLVPEAVAACQRAGIIVRMVTGDNVKTARRIAELCGIWKPGGLVMEGSEFAKMDDKQLDKLLPTLQVLARATPMDKYRLVDRLRIAGQVVAVTGDGTNDAPALKKADVGLSMGIAGTEVAKEASDIIIMDDNFVSVVRSVMWGRNVFSNIRKFLQFQLTINAVALMTAFVGAITQYGTPLKAVQLLWVNLIMDTFAALALGTERPTSDLLNKKPYGRHSALISNIMWRNIIGMGLFQVSIMFMIVYGGTQIWGLEQNGHDYPTRATVHYTMVFNTFVFLQVFNELNARKVNTDKNVFDGLHRNWIFLVILAGTVVGQVLIVEFGSDFTSTTPLTPIQWVSCVGLGALALPVGLILRLIPVRLEPHEKPSSDSEDMEELAFLVKRETKKKPSVRV